jgi:hypothetical protein
MPGHVSHYHVTVRRSTVAFIMVSSKLRTAKKRKCYHTQQLRLHFTPYDHDLAYCFSSYTIFSVNGNILNLVLNIPK